MVRWLHVLMLEPAVTRMRLGSGHSRDKIIRKVYSSKIPDAEQYIVMLGANCLIPGLIPLDPPLPFSAS